MRDYHDSCDLIWKIEKNLGPTLNLNPKEVCKISTPKHVACPKYVIYWKIPQVILRSKFSYLTIGKYLKDGDLEIHVFVTLGDL